MTNAYDAYTKAFHWGIAIIVFAEYIFVWLIPEGTRGPTALASYHMSFGILVIALMLARFVWYFFGTHPAPDPAAPRWQEFASKSMHITLYILLLVLPFSGWLWISANDWNVTLFSAVPLPHILAKSAALGTFFRGAHELLASAVLALVGLHVAASVYHWLIVKDDVMQRMLP